MTGISARKGAVRPWRGLVAIQLLLVALVVLGSLFAPPREGQMLALPLWPQSQGDTLNWVLARDGRLVGVTSLGGALIVEGTRGRLLPAALRHGALLIGLPNAACGRRANEKWR